MYKQVCVFGRVFPLWRPVFQIWGFFLRFLIEAFASGKYDYRKQNEKYDKRLGKNAIKFEHF